MFSLTMAHMGVREAAAGAGTSLAVKSPPATAPAQSVALGVLALAKRRSTLGLHVSEAQSDEPRIALNKIINMIW